MGDIRQPSDSGGGDTYPSSFIQCNVGKDPNIHELWCHRVDGICFKVQPTAGIDIPAETIRQFVTEYLSDNGWHNRILENLASTSAFDSLEFLIFGEVNCHIFPILGPQRPPSGGAELVLLIPLGSGVEGPLIPLILVPLLLLVVGVEVSLIPL